MYGSFFLSVTIPAMELYYMDARRIVFGGHWGKREGGFAFLVVLYFGCAFFHMKRGEIRLQRGQPAHEDGDGRAGPGKNGRMS